jgi:hypothetical protein
MIFVNIASYRDPELAPTVLDAIANADRPEELSFGICWQRVAGSDDGQVEPLERVPRLRLLAADAHESKGVCWARAQSATLALGEELTLQIDSHMRFGRKWDSCLKRMLSKCPKRSLLTSYVPAYTPPNTRHDHIPRYLGAQAFTPFGILVLGSRAEVRERKPQLGAFISAHFLFGPSNFWSECPYDPNLYFHGEEISLSARAFTSGWRVYYPNRAVLYHEYTREGRPKHWEEHPSWSLNDLESQRRVGRLLGVKTSDGPSDGFGLGTLAKLTDYERFSGVRFNARAFTQAAFEGRVAKVGLATAVRARFLPHISARRSRSPAPAWS